MKELIEENPSFENLDKIEALFDQFANKTYQLQSYLHDRIDSIEDLYNSKPSLCENKRKINSIASMTKSIEITLPRLLSTLRRSNQVKRMQIVYKPTPRGPVMDWIFPSVRDFSDDVKQVSRDVMEGIQNNAVESMDKMKFVVTDLLGKQV